MRHRSAVLTNPAERPHRSLTPGPREPVSTAICTVTHSTVISRHLQAAFGRLCLHLAPGYQASSSGRDPCWGVALGKRLDNVAPISRPTPSLSMHHYIPAAPPHQLLPQRFRPETRALGGSSVPRAFPFACRPPSPSLFFDVLPLAAVGVGLCRFLTCTSFPQPSEERDAILIW